MKQLILLINLLLLTSSVSAKTIFVSPTGNGNGESWMATANLATAMQLAEPGDQVWFTSGTFYPTTTNDRNASITFSEGVSLFGGFAGTEQQVAERPAGSKTIFSGNIGNRNTEKDNSYTVLLLTNPSNMVVIDGFIIRDGAAKGFNDNQMLATAGGGLFIDGGKQPTIRNCHFLNNTGRYGGAVYIKAGMNQQTAPNFSYCIFADNKTDFEGGAVSNYAKNRNSNPSFRFCEFNNNRSDYGAAIANNGTNGVAKPLIFACSFNSNFALSDGAVFYSNLDGDNGDGKPVINQCLYNDNKAQFGEEISISHNNKSLNAASTTGGRLKPTAN